MAKTHSWLPRLHEIRRRVMESPQSHYTRAQLQELFQIQQTTAAGLMAALPVERMNLGLLVAREALLEFLEKVRDTDDVTGLLAEMKATRRAPSRRKMRSMVRRTFEPTGFEGLPAGVELRRGFLGIRFETVDELVTAEFAVARLLADELEEFARRYEAIPVREPDEAELEVKRLFDDLEEMKRERGLSGAGAKFGAGGAESGVEHELVP